MRFRNIFKKKEEETITGTAVNVKIIRHMADRIPVQVAYFKAYMTKDENFNLTLEQKSEDFKEDYSMEKLQIIENLKLKLKLTDLTLDEKIKTVKEAIQKQQGIIKEIQQLKGYVFQRDKEGNIEYHAQGGPKKIEVNIIDQQKLLRHYETLLHKIKNEGEGTYEGINLEGEREITFLSKDGVLVPVYYNSSEATQYPDMSTKRKLYRQYNDMLEKRFLEAQQDFFGTVLGKIVTIVMIILFIANILWSHQNFQNSKEINVLLDSSVYKNMLDQAQNSAIKCAYYYTSMMQDNGELMNSIKKMILNETQEGLQRTAQQEKNRLSELIDLTNPS
jgi:hypothetical protein